MRDFLISIFSHTFQDVVLLNLTYMNFKDRVLLYK